MNQIKIAAIQMAVTDHKANNLAVARREIAAAAKSGADLVVLPEMFICPYQTDVFPQYAETSDGPTVQALAKQAASDHIWLIAGSIPEADAQGSVYNTSFVFNREGQIVARHRKVHLFSIDVQGGQYFQEADTLKAGDTTTLIDTEFGRIGLCICFDFRFPELARKMTLAGAQLIVVPGAFNQTTGPAHWELMFRSRAVDNQIFTLGCAPARNFEASYQSWGHSILVDPWGKVIQQLDEQSGEFLISIDFDDVEKTRKSLPLLSNRRPDIY